ncbi:MAG: DUF2508 family protein [Clostridia bacterium]|nr:DUF2508 family protein [Clostridia bacterium]
MKQTLHERVRCRKETAKTQKEEAALLAQLQETARKLENAYARFDYEQNDQLLDAVIFEIQSLRALYRYLFKRARALGVECGRVQVFRREEV